VNFRRRALSAAVELYICDGCLDSVSVKAIGGSSPPCWGGARPPISGQGRGPMGRSPRPKWPRAEVGSWGGDSQPPRPPAKGAGERCKLLQWVCGGAAIRKTFSYILETPYIFSRNLLGAKLGGMPPCPPFKSAYVDSAVGADYCE